MGAIVQAFGWREAVPIYVDNEFGEGIVPSLTDALEQVNVHIPYRSVIPSSATDDNIVAAVYKLMAVQTRVFIVHMLTGLGSRLFTKAKLVGMMSEDYVWIITDGMTNKLNSIDHSVMEAMQGVVGHIPNTKELHNFTIQYKKELQQHNPANPDLDLTIFGLWAYDFAVALAMAVEKGKDKKCYISQQGNDSTTSTDLELIWASSSTTFRGLAGEFELVEGQLHSPPYQIVYSQNPMHTLSRLQGKT